MKGVESGRLRRRLWAATLPACHGRGRTTPAFIWMSFLSRLCIGPLFRQLSGERAYHCGDRWPRSEAGEELDGSGAKRPLSLWVIAALRTASLPIGAETDDRFLVRIKLSHFGPTMGQSGVCETVCAMSNDTARTTMPAPQSGTVLPRQVLRAECRPREYLTPKEVDRLIFEEGRSGTRPGCQPLAVGLTSTD